MGRKLHAVVTSVLLVLALSLSAQGAVPAQSASLHSSARISALEDQLHQWVNHELEVYHWKADAVDITPVSVDADSSEVTGLFDVKITHRLAYSTPDEVPALKGRKAFLEHGITLNSTERAFAEEEIQQWETTLQGYIDTPQEAWESFKVTAALGPDGRVLPGSTEIYSEDPVGRFVRADDVLKNVPTPDEAEVGARQAIAEKVRLLKARANTNTSPVLATADYNRTNAVNYINLYTSNTQLACSSTSSTPQDTSYYNWNYTWYQCNDCANYVSQAMYAGGIPQDSSWKPGNSTWTYVPDLRDYMTAAGSGHYHWALSTFGSMVGGDVIMLTPKGSTVPDHVMMVIYNDGSVIQFSAHTSDRKGATWVGGGTTYTATYYIVV